MTWTPPSATGGAIFEYLVSAQSDGGFVNGVNAAAIDAGLATTVTLGPLTVGATYWFDVVALDAYGAGPAGSSNAVVAFDVPGAPGAVTAVAQGGGNAQVSWTPAADNFSPVTYYTVTSDPDAGTVGTDGGSVTVRGLTIGTQYVFSVTATNAAGDGQSAISNAITPFPVVSTLAGNGTYGFFDGTGGAPGTTKFAGPSSVAVDAQGNVYVADTDNNRIRKIAPDGTTSTLAGNGTYGFFDGTAGALGTTEFAYPSGVAVDSQGNVYVADSLNNRIRKVAPDGSTATLAGNGTQGFFDGTGGASGTTEFSQPLGVAVDAQGNVYVADQLNHRIRKVASDGPTTTLAGNGTREYFDGTGGASGTTEFAFPSGVAVDSQGNVFVADSANERIRKIAPDGSTSTLTGNYTQGYFDGTGGASGTTEFNAPYGVAVDAQGNVYVADDGNNRIRKVAPNGSTTTLAGNGTAAFFDGSGGVSGTSEFNNPGGVAVDAQGNVYVADFRDNRIREIAAR